MEIQYETFVQKNGLGALELRGGELEIGIWVNGAPLIFDAADCEGSIGRFTILFDGTPKPKIAAQIAHDAALGFPSTKSLVESVRPLLDLMPNGTYDLWLQNIEYGAEEWQIIDWESHQQYSSGKKAGIYPDEAVLVFTQPYKSLNQETILRYVEAIEGGSNPAGICWLSPNQSARFVLDGHHKIAAYWLLQRSARALFIRSVPSSNVSGEAASEIVEPFGEKDYLTNKTRVKPPIVARFSLP